MQKPGKDVIRLIVQGKQNEILASSTQTVDQTLIIIPDSYQMYEFEPGQEESFLLIDSGEIDPEHVLVYGSQSHVNWSSEMKITRVNRTFQPSSSLFLQADIEM